jgi:hypothetical protein
MKRTPLLLSLLLMLAEGAAPALAKPEGPAPTKTPASASTAPKSGKLAAATRPGVKKPVVVGTTKGAKRAKKPCYARPVQLVRVRGEQVEPRELALTMCNGAPNPAALDSVSVLARPRDVERPLMPEIRAYRALPVAKGKISPKSKKKKHRDPLFLTPKVMRVHPGLLVRLQKIANRYPGKIIEIISGYRPDSRDTSRHHHGRALDLRVSGVTRERLRDFLRTFEDTGVGYYPNSYFVHMDVRDQKGYWVDRSGPGEPADYGPWPRKQDIEHTRESVLRGALADLAELGKPSRQSDKRTAMAQPTAKKVPVRQPEQERDDMSEREVAEVRAEARRALESL